MQAKGIPTKSNSQKGFVKTRFYFNEKTQGKSQFAESHVIIFFDSRRLKNNVLHKPFNEI